MPRIGVSSYCISFLYSFSQGFRLWPMAGVTHGTARTSAAAGWSSFSLTAYHTGNDGSHQENQNRADNDRRHIFHKPCKHWNSSRFPVINLNEKPGVPSSGGTPFRSASHAVISPFSASYLSSALSPLYMVWTAYKSYRRGLRWLQAGRWYSGFL